MRIKLVIVFSKEVNGKLKAMEETFWGPGTMERIMADIEIMRQRMDKRSYFLKSLTLTVLD